MGLLKWIETRSVGVLPHPCILRWGGGRQWQGVGKKEMARVGQMLGNKAVLPNSPMRTEHFEYTHIGRLSNFSACRMTAKNFSAPAAHPSWPQISIWGKTGSKTFGVRRGGGHDLNRPPPLTSPSHQWNPKLNSKTGPMNGKKSIPMTDTVR